MTEPAQQQQPPIPSGCLWATLGCCGAFGIFAVLLLGSCVTSFG